VALSLKRVRHTENVALCASSSAPCDIHGVMVTSHCPEGYVPIHVACSYSPAGAIVWEALLQEWVLPEDNVDGYPDSYFYTNGALTFVQGDAWDDPTTAACALTGIIQPFSDVEVTVDVVCVEEPTYTLVP
jgi:hypothetical protein